MVQKFKTLADAVALAEYAHRNQTDKAGLPYIEHPRRVMQKVQAQGALPYVQIAAILHDVTEDTAFTVQMLRDLGFSEAAVDAVGLLDRDASKIKFETWNAQFEKNKPNALSGTADEFYYHAIKQNPGALLVKLADIEDNLSPWRLSYLSEETQERLKAKYAKARQILQPGIWSNPYYPYAPPN